MSDTTTTKCGFTKPEVGGSTDSWGTKLNDDLDALDAMFETGPYLKIAKGGTGAGTAANARMGLGLGTIATQDAATPSLGAVAAASLALSGGATIGGTAAVTGQLTATGGIKFADNTSMTTAPLGTDQPFTDKATNFTASTNTRYRITANNVQMTLPAAPTDGQWVQIYTRQTGCSALRNGKTISGVADDLALDAPLVSLTFVYRSASGDWMLT